MTHHMYARNGSKQGDEAASNVAQKSNSKVSDSESSTLDSFHLSLDLCGGRHSDDLNRNP